MERQLIPQLHPLDEHNRRLADNVHPAEWTNPAPSGRYNMVVIGAGTAGLVTAAGAAGLGAKVALVERDLMGGDCLNVGCVPSKALLACARAAAGVRVAAAYGVRIDGEVTVDFPAVMERMRALRAAISPNDSAQRFRDLGVDVFFGEGRFAGPDRIEVDGQVLQFSRACIATGARAAQLPIPGLREAGFLTNETVFSLTALPARMAVIGAGPIGCELSQAFARFGSKVTLLEQGAQILGREDRDAADRVAEALVRDGVQIRCGAMIKAAERGGSEKILSIADGQEVRADEILLGAGRTPNLEGLNLDAAGIEHDAAGLKVNDRLRTTNPRVFGAGDVCFPYKFTHVADATARIVLRNALFFGRARASALTIPWCTYTDPEIAHVGMYPRDAQQRNIEIDTFTVELGDVDRAILDGRTQGFLKVHVRRGSGVIVGATLVGAHAGEIISELTLAMKAGAGLGAIADTIHPYPTQAEAIKRAADAYGRTRLTPRVKRMFEWLMKMRR